MAVKALKHSAAWYADRYINTFNMNLVPLSPASKLPRFSDWGDTNTAAQYWEEFPQDNIGLNLGASGYCSFDIDCLKSLQIILSDYGLPFEDLEQYPTIRGASKGRRILFRVPDGVVLPYVKLNWPTEDDPSKRYTVFELRASERGGKARQDVLPPSIHPDTGEAYVWETQPAKTFDEWPTPPDWLLAIWLAWESFKPQLIECCPWLPKTERKEPPKPRAPQVKTGLPDVQTMFNEAHDLEQMLEQYGYTRRGRRYLSPHSSTGLAGVHVFNGGSHCWIHHASDPLCSDETGQPVSCYDLYTHYEHAGDRSKAFKSAAKLLGVELKTQRSPSNEVATHNEDRVKPVQNPHFIEWPHQTDKGAARATIDNLRTLLNVYDIRTRYNVIAKEEEILIPDRTYSLANAKACASAEIRSLAGKHALPQTNIDEFLLSITDETQFNPVVTWVSSKVWDGQDRFEDLFESLGVKTNHELARVLLRRWLISAIAAAYRPQGIAAQGMLVFHGAQGTGKTSWFKALLGDHTELGKEGAILNPDDKDSVKSAISHWLVELGEVDATFRKSDIASLKAFITRDKDQIFLRYSRKESSYPRQTVFFASVNDDRFLKDNTGNRRYWTIATGADLNPNHGLDMQQVWAQVLTWFEAGERWELTQDELKLLNEANQEFEEIDPFEELIRQNFDFDTAHDSEYTATQLLIKLGYDRPDKRNANAIAKVLREKFLLDPVKRKTGLVYQMPSFKYGA